MLFVDADLSTSMLTHKIEPIDALALSGQILPEHEAMIVRGRHCGMQVEHRPGNDVAIAHIGGNA